MRYVSHELSLHRPDHATNQTNDLALGKESPNFLPVYTPAFTCRFKFGYRPRLSECYLCIGVVPGGIIG